MNAPKLAASPADGIRVNLVCWHCGSATLVEVSHQPQFAFEIAGWANDVGMLGVMDIDHGRCLVFCNQEHADAQKTKSGGYRVHPRVTPLSASICNQPTSATAIAPG